MSKPATTLDELVEESGLGVRSAAELHDRWIRITEGESYRVLETRICGIELLQVKDKLILYIHLAASHSAEWMRKKPIIALSHGPDMGWTLWSGNDGVFHTPVTVQLLRH